MKAKLLFFSLASYLCFTSFTPPPEDRFKIIIDKSDYELSVYEDGEWSVTYPVVFGNDDQGDKMIAGDKKTPEGNFKIIAKRNHKKWCRFMALDYPTKESYDKFNQRKANKQIPQAARIGGDVGIHGTWPHDDYLIDRYKNWTLGCIALKNDDLVELYDMVPVGTPILVQK
jgi:murein L,D-transpeptidase YafK